jgi:hypothetical protein
MTVKTVAGGSCDILNLFLFFFAMLGFELRAYILSYSTCPIFVMGIFEIGSHELFAWAGFEPGPS